jgi:hypothetical protein
MTDFTGSSFVKGAKQRLRSLLSPKICAGARRTQRSLRALCCPSDLGNLALLYGSDKWMSHWYTQHYGRHFSSLRRRPITLLEIGIGGDADPLAGGASLRMWRRYFPRGRICGVDVHDKRAHAGIRIRTFQGDQGNEAFLRKVVAEIGAPDVIIDDGSHFNNHVIQSFHVLFPLLAPNGIYVVEDIQTSYWPHYGGSSADLVGARTSMCLFKVLVDGINHEEFVKPGYRPSYFDEHIVSIHFYHNLVFIHKGSNKEGSIVKNNLPLPGMTEI